MLSASVTRGTAPSDAANASAHDAIDSDGRKPSGPSWGFAHATFCRGFSCFPEGEARTGLKLVARWIDPLAAALRDASAFRGYALRDATHDDEALLYALHRDGLRQYVDATWGWEEEWQRAHFAGQYQANANAIIVRKSSSPQDVGRLSLTRHWRKIFLRDIELIASERNRGIGGAIIGSVLTLAANSGRHVELLVLKCNPAQRLYERMGFRPVSDDGARLRMRAL